MENFYPFGVVIKLLSDFPSPLNVNIAALLLTLPDSFFVKFLASFADFNW